MITSAPQGVFLFYPGDKAHVALFYFLNRIKLGCAFSENASKREKNMLSLLGTRA